MRYLAFLRAINVGGHTVKMDSLRTLFQTLGFREVETFIASGNVIFNTDSRDTATLENSIETSLRKALGFEVTTFLRPDSEVNAISEYRAFSDAELSAARTYCVGFLKGPLETNQEKTLYGLTTEIDSFHVYNREIYWLCRKKQSESTFSNAVLEKALGVRATFRGYNTVLKLAAKYPPGDSRT